MHCWTTDKQLFFIVLEKKNTEVKRHEDASSPITRSVARNWAGHFPTIGLFLHPLNEVTGLKNARDFLLLRHVMIHDLYFVLSASHVNAPKETNGAKEKIK